MNQIFRRSACAAVVMALLAGVGAVVPALADETPAAAQPAAAAAAMAHADKHVEARIKDMHARLGITAAQEDAWRSVAQAMRDNAESMSTLTQARIDKAGTMTAVEDLKSYAEIAQQHADSINKFAPVFETLYDSLSDQQKLNADRLFRAHSRESMKHMTSKAG